MAAKKSGKSKKLTTRQNAFVRELAKGATLKSAQVKAGYTSKNAGQSGYQALKQIQQKVPEIMDRHGLTDDSLIENYLIPLLNAKETKFFKDRDKRINVAALGIRLSALENAFKLRGSYAPRDPAEAAQFGVKVIVVDIPRPPKLIDVGSNGHMPPEDEE